MELFRLLFKWRTHLFVRPFRINASIIPVPFANGGAGCLGLLAPLAASSGVNTKGLPDGRWMSFILMQVCLHGKLEGSQQGAVL